MDPSIDQFRRGTSGNDNWRSVLLAGHLTASMVMIAQPPPGYYDPAAGLSGAALKQALHGIIDDHTVLSNAGLWNAFYTTDDRPGNSVWDIYSDVPGGTPPYLYTLGSDQCGTYNSEGDCYNREHSFPLSWFNDEPPMDTDLHHIYPTDAWVNMKHGNLPYGEVGSADFTSLNGTRTGPSTWPGYSGDVCEPIDAYKGDLARTYFYMMTRYLPDVADWTSDMLAGDDLAPWAEAMLLQWHTDDPVSTKETDRNNAVFALQDNRNPYIDHPEWVPAIWGPFAGSVEVVGDVPRMWISEGSLFINGIEDPWTLVIHDAMGRTVFSEQVSGDRSIPVDLPRGIYIATITTGGMRTAARSVFIN